jgi:hypothetical protein
LCADHGYPNANLENAAEISTAGAAVAHAEIDEISKFLAAQIGC